MLKQTTARDAGIRRAVDESRAPARAGRALGGSTDPNAIHRGTSGEIAAITLKATPLPADMMVIESDADGDAKRRILLSALGLVVGLGHTIREDAGDMTDRLGLHFDDAHFALTDDVGNDETDVALNLGMTPTWVGLHAFDAGVEINSSFGLHSTRNPDISGSFIISSDTVAHQFGPDPGQAAFIINANGNADHHTIWTDRNDAAIMRLTGLATFQRLTTGDINDDQFIHEDSAGMEITGTWVWTSITQDFSGVTNLLLGKNGVHVGTSPPAAGAERLWIDTNAPAALKIDFTGTGTYFNTGIGA